LARLRNQIWLSQRKFKQLGVVMNTADINTKLIDSYISLLKNMSAQNKLDLISKLTDTVKTDIEKEKNQKVLENFLSGIQMLEELSHEKSYCA
jgi:uncharacterized tellurite resistance protein B-like protein